MYLHEFSDIRGKKKMWSSIVFCLVICHSATRLPMLYNLESVVVTSKTVAISATASGISITRKNSTKQLSDAIFFLSTLIYRADRRLTNVFNAGLIICDQLEKYVPAASCRSWAVVRHMFYENTRGSYSNESDQEDLQRMYFISRSQFLETFDSIEKLRGWTALEKVVLVRKSVFIDSKY